MGVRHRLEEIIPTAYEMLASDSEWRDFLTSAPSVHLAILVEPFLGYILEGRKTIESRFSLNRGAPFQRVFPGDLVFLKRSSGPVVGMARVERPEFVFLNGDSWRRIRTLSEPLCADEEFWRARAGKRYATLMHLGPVRSISLTVDKTDRRPWLVLRRPRESSALPLFA